MRRSGKRTYQNTAYIVSLLIAIATIIFQYSTAYNYEYSNVTTKLNITDAYPEIDSVNIDQSIILTAGSVKTINCNISLHDWNGFSDIVSVNATLWDNQTSSYGSIDDPNNHYTNTSCLNISQNGYYANYTCSFQVWYYANNGTNWICNATAKDTYNFTTSNSNTSTILAYYALNITTPLIDFGNMVLADYSPNITVNITNIGNGKINLSVLGYGGNNKATGNGYAMFCQSGNITIENQRFSSNTQSWAAKTPLSSTLQNITGITIPKTITQTPTWNLTYWQLYTDPTNNPFGICNGTVEFDAYTG